MILTLSNDGGKRIKIKAAKKNIFQSTTFYLLILARPSIHSITRRGFTAVLLIPTQFHSKAAENHHFVGLIFSLICPHKNAKVAGENERKKMRRAIDMRVIRPRFWILPPTVPAFEERNCWSSSCVCQCRGTAINMCVPTIPRDNGTINWVIFLCICCCIGKIVVYFLF